MTTHVAHMPGEPCTARCTRKGVDGTLLRVPVLGHATADSTPNPDGSHTALLVQDPSTATLTLTPAGRRVLRQSKRARTRAVYAAVFVLAFGLGTLFGLVLQ